MDTEYVKENVIVRRPLPLRWVVAALGVCGAALLFAVHIDSALPEPLRRGAPLHKFIAEIAHEHLVNLTSIGPRVAGSYENDVLAVGVVAEAIRRISREAAPHNRVELDVHTASGAFPLDFLDGMNNVYSGVRSVIGRVRGAGGPTSVRRRSALLFNCHIDTVPDSPGASDDGAGCAVLLETMRALAAARSPLRHDAVFLFNGAEENIMQASHGFVAGHEWARSVRAFVNVEACGAGGREVLFQAGPHDPWLVEAYAAAAPHPFASSLAQELFESGLIPADTDFRVFRDFGALSGLDLAWSANGHVYHTRLDTADRVPPASLQRAGDNVLAFAHEVLSGEQLEATMERGSPTPVFFDVLGTYMVCVRPGAAAAAAAGAVLLVALQLRVGARAGGGRRWLRAVGRAAAARVLAAGAGLAAAALVAATLHAAGAPLPYYSRPWLLAPLYAAPALGVAWWVLLRTSGSGGGSGWGAARVQRAAGAALAAGAVAACGAARLRSGFVPALWCAAAAGELVAGLVAGGAARAALCAAASLPTVLQLAYLAVAALRTLVPVAGRAGARALPADVPVAVLVAALALLLADWVHPLLVVARRPHRLVAWMLLLCGTTCLLVCTTSLGAPYSAEAPQRLMVLHTRRTLHAPVGAAPVEEDAVYWVPELDANTARLVRSLETLAGARRVSREECAARVYCGAPYFLPALSLVPRSLHAPAPAPPALRVRVTADSERINSTAVQVTLHAEGAAGARLVAVLSPAEGAYISWSDAVPAPQQSTAWGARRVYFYMVHRAAEEASWRLRVMVRHAEDARPAPLLDVSVAAHALWGAHARSPPLAALLAALPPTVAATAWTVDMHLLSV